MAPIIISKMRLIWVQPVPETSTLASQHADCPYYLLHWMSSGLRREKPRMQPPLIRIRFRSTGKSDGIRHSRSSTCTSPIIANRPIGEHFSNLGFSGSSGRFWYLANVGLRRSDFVRGICGGMGKCQFSVSLIVGFSIVFYYLRLVSGWAITALAYFRVFRMPAGRQVSGIIFGYLYRTPGRDVFHHTMLLPVIKFSCMKV